MQINKQPECEVIKKTLSKTQKDWVDYFNNKGEKMISAPDIYRAIKEKDKVMPSLKDDLEKDYIVTSTRIDRKKKQIIHDAESKLVKEKIINCEIPEFNGSFKEDKETETYLKALFDTKDSLKEILKNLNILGENKELRLWTSSNKDSVRAVRLCFCDGGFGVVGSGWIGYGGLSRGVKIDSAKQCKKVK